jgi:hypothetical protein
MRSYRVPLLGNDMPLERLNRIFQGYGEGATTYELGDRFGIDRRTVSTSSIGTACKCVDVASPPTKSTTPSTSTTLAGLWHGSAST